MERKLTAERIYCDYAATTPLSPEAREAMEPWLGQEFGNPSSTHREGRHAKEAIDAAREIVSQAMGCLFAEVQFTSSGTEAANAAIFGVALANLAGPRRRIFLGAAEHHCVLHTAALLEKWGFHVEFVSPNQSGAVEPDRLAELISDDVLLVSLMHANNETGAISDVPEVSEIAHRHGAIMHTDAVQTFLSHPWSAESLGADLASVSAHKIYGPKAIGALFVRAGLELCPILVGGGQEREQRGGTENVAGIMGFGAAVASYRADQRSAARDAFRQHLTRELGENVMWTLYAGEPELTGHAHFRIPGCTSESMLISLDRDGVAASAGAACSSGSLEPSHVLLACGYSGTEASEGLRFTFGRESTAESAIEAARRVVKIASRIRSAGR